MTSEAGRSPFIVEPYLQIGIAPRLLGQVQMTVMWHTEEVEAAWKQNVAGARVGRKRHRCSRGPNMKHQV